MQKRTLRLLATSVAVLAMAGAGCRARADVVVDVEGDGSGSVTVTATLDDEAVEQLGDLDSALRLDDLEATGWSTDGPTKRGDVTVLAVTKEFGDASQLGPIMTEVGGTGGPFRDWKLTSSNSFTVSSYELSGTMNLTGSLDQFSDSEVAAALDGFATGRTPDEIAAALKDDPDALQLGVGVSLPGELENATGLDPTDPDPNVAAKHYRLGDGIAVDTVIDLRSSASDRTSVLWILVGGALVVAAVVLAVAGRRQATRSRRPRRTSMS